VAKALWLQAYDENYPSKRLACEAVGIELQTFSKHYHADPQFAEAMDEITNQGRGRYHDKLFKCADKAMDDFMDKGDSKGSALVMFVGKTMMGLQEKTQIDINERRVNVNINMDLSDKSDKELIKMLEGKSRDRE